MVRTHHTGTGGGGLCSQYNGAEKYSEVPVINTRFFLKSWITCRYDDSTLIGGHVWGRDVLLIHVASVAHLGGVSAPHHLIAFTHTAVHGRLFAAETEKKPNTFLHQFVTETSGNPSKY